eukprot:g435.t1
MQEYNIEFTYFRNELKLRRKTLSNSTKIEKVTPTESQTHVTIRIAKKKRWEFVQDGDIILDENEAHRFVEGRDVKVFTQYLSILNSVAIHTDTLAIGTMPLPLIPENIGSLLIKECHVKNLDKVMEFLINDITANTKQNERDAILKKWTARLKFTIEVARKNNSSTTIPVEREDMRWRNSFALMLHESHNEKPIAEKYYVKRPNFEEKFLATADSIEWLLSEDATECLRSQHVEILVRRPLHISQAAQRKSKDKGNEISGIKFLSRCYLRIELKVKKENEPTCFLLTSVNIPLNTFLDNTWMTMIVKQSEKKAMKKGKKNANKARKNVGGLLVKKKKVVRTPFTNLSDCYPWKFPLNVEISKEKDAKDYMEKASSGNNTGKQKKNKTSKDNEDEELKIMKNIQKRVSTALHKYASHPNEAKLFLKGGVNEDSLIGQLKFLDQNWLSRPHILEDGTKRGSFHFTLEHEHVHHYEHTFMDDATNHALVEGIRLYKTHEKTIPYDFAEVADIDMSTSFHILYKTCEDISVGIHVDQDNMVENLQEKFSIKTDDGQEHQSIVNDDYSDNFPFGLIGSEILFQLNNNRQFAPSLIYVNDKTAITQTESGEFENDFHSYSKLKYGNFKMKSCTDKSFNVSPSLIEKATQATKVEINCEYCEEKARSMKLNYDVNPATHLCVHSVPVAETVKGVITDISLEDNLYTLEFVNGNITKVSLEIGGDKFPRIGDIRMLPLDIQEAIVIKKLEDEYHAKFKDGTVRRFPRRDWSVTEIEMTKFLPKTTLITQNPYAKGYLCGNCFWETHNVTDSIWIEVGESLCSECREVALVPLTINNHAIDSKLFPLQLQLHKDPWANSTGHDANDSLIWVCILRRWYQYHKKFDHGVHFKEDEIRFRPSLDSLELTFLSEDAELLKGKKPVQIENDGKHPKTKKKQIRQAPRKIKRRQPISTVLNAASYGSHSLSKLQTVGIMLFDTLQRYLKRFSQHKPYQSRGNLVKCLGIVRSALSIMLNTPENADVDFLTKLMDSCAKTLFCQVEIRNLSHSKHHDVDSFAHTACNVDGQVYLLGGIGTKFIPKGNKNGSLKPMNLWVNLSTNVQDDVLKDGNEIFVLDRQEGLMIRHAHLHDDDHMLKRFGHSATVHQQNIIIFGGCRGKYIDHNLKFQPGRPNKKNHRCKALRDLCIFDTTTFECQKFKHIKESYSGVPSKGRYGHSADLFTVKFNNQESSIDCVLIWGGRYSNGTFVGSNDKGREVEDIVRIFCHYKGQYFWLSGSFNPLSGSWDSSNNALPKLHMANIVKTNAPISSAFHCSVVVEDKYKHPVTGCIINTQSILFFGGVTGSSESVPSTNMYLLRIHNAVDEMQVLLSWEMYTEANVEGTAPVFHYSNASVTSSKGKIYVLAANKLYTLHRVAFKSIDGVDIWKWEIGAIIGSRKQSIGSALVKYDCNTLACIGGICRLDGQIPTQEKLQNELKELVSQGEFMAGNENDKYHPSTSLLFISDVIGVSTNKVTEESKKRALSALETDSNCIQLRHFFEHDSDMKWWIEHFGGNFSEVLDQIFRVLTAQEEYNKNGFHTPLEFLHPSEQDIAALKICFDIYDTGVIDLFALRIFAGENGIVRTFLEMKLRLQYFKKSFLNEKGKEEEDLRDIYMGDHKYLHKEHFDVDRLKADATKWLHESVDLLKSRTDFNFHEESWATMKRMEDGHTELCGGIVVAFSACLLCLKLDVHLDDIDHRIFPLVLDVLHQQHAVEEDENEDRFVRETITDFVLEIIKYEAESEEKYNILSKDSITCNILAEKLYETSVERHGVFLENETARRMRDEMCVIFKFLAEDPNFPTHKDLYNFGIVPSLQALRINSWGQEESIAPLCEEILGELLGGVNHLDHFGSNSSLEYETLKLLAEIRGIQRHEGYKVIHQYLECCNLTKKYSPNVITVEGSGINREKLLEIAPCLKDTNFEKEKIIYLSKFFKEFLSLEKAKLRHAEEQMELFLESLHGKKLREGTPEFEKLKQFNVLIDPLEKIEKQVNIDRIELSEIEENAPELILRIERAFALHIDVATKNKLRDHLFESTLSCHKWDDFKRVFKHDVKGAFPCGDTFISGFMHSIVEIMKLSKFTSPLVACEIRTCVAKIIILASASSSLFQSYADIELRCLSHKYAEEIVFAGGFHVLIELILDNRTLELSTIEINYDEILNEEIKDNLQLYFERDEKRIDRFISLALITLLNTLPVYFNKHPHDHEQLQATLQKRIQASEPYKGMCNTFIDSMAEALYLLIHVFPTYGNKEIVWCSEIVNLATKSIDQEHWPEFRSKKRFDLLNRWVESAWDGMTLKSENGGNAHLWWSNIIKDEDMDPHRKSHQAAGNSIEDLMKKDHNDEKMKDVSIMGMKSDGTCGVQ